MSAPVVPAAPPPAPIAAPVARAETPWKDDERFRVRVEQDGADVPVLDHEVTVARRAFTLDFELKDGTDFVAVNASYTKRTLELAASHAPLVDMDSVFGLGHGAAEELDPPHGVFVDDESFNLWGWREDMHRCHLHETPPGAQFALCKRVIETFRRGMDKVRVEESRARALYLVVMALEPDGDTQHELQRDWLTISFSPAAP